MKKAKFMLTAVAVVAIAAGVVAAKANAPEHHLYIDNGSGTCTSVLPSATTASNLGGEEVILTNTFVNSVSVEGTCSQITDYYTGITTE